MNGNPYIRIDLHTHTWFSADALMSPATLVTHARAAGLDRIAVTDHNSIDGALAAHALDPELVIVGEEVRCACGTDLIGLFLRDFIRPDQSLEETARQIRAQGGVVYAPHPYAYLRSPKTRSARVIAVADVVEVFNARAFMPAWNRRALAAASSLGLPAAAGTDAHTSRELGRAYTAMPPFHDAASFLSGLARAQPCGLRRSSPFIHVLSLTLQGARAAVGRRHGDPPRRDRDYHQRTADRTPSRAA